MIAKDHKEKTFYGTTTLGEKGQAVIPVEAREALKIKKGEKLLVFGMGCDMVVFTKLSHLEKFASHLQERLRHIEAVMKTTRSSKE